MKIQTKILVIDDERLILDCFECAFPPPAYEVSTAHSVKLGIELFRTERPDVVVLDVRMPELSGVELMRLLRVGHPAARFVLMSAYTQDAELDPTQDTVAAVLTKPLDLPSLAKVLGLDA